MTSTAQAKRRGHRRGQAQPMSPTAHRRARGAAQRQCCICRGQKMQTKLLQLGPVPEAAGEALAPRAGRHSYVCISATCLRQMAQRMAPKKAAPHAACQAFCAPLMRLAETRVTEAIGLARRQGLLVMGAARIIESQRKGPQAPGDDGAFFDGANVPYDIDEIDEDDIDDDDDEDAADLLLAGRPQPTDTAVDGGTHGSMNVFTQAEPNGAQDIILLAADAAERTARRLGPTALPSMLHGTAMGRAAGGAHVAAVAIPRGRLALQAAYWLQVWYEARAVLTTPESMMN